MNNTPPTVEYEQAADVLTICGIRYAADMFRDLGWRLAIGETFRIRERDDGRLVVSRISEDGIIEEARAIFKKEVFEAAVAVEVSRLRARGAWQRLLDWFR